MTSPLPTKEIKQLATNILKATPFNAQRLCQLYTNGIFCIVNTGYQYRQTDYTSWDHSRFIEEEEEQIFQASASSCSVAASEAAVLLLALGEAELVADEASQAVC